jgi:hypothetical protein
MVWILACYPVCQGMCCCLEGEPAQGGKKKPKRVPYTGLHMQASAWICCTCSAALCTAGTKPTCCTSCTNDKVT